MVIMFWSVAHTEYPIVDGDERLSSDARRKLQRLLTDRGRGMMMMVVVVVEEERDEMDKKSWETDTDSQEGRSDSHGTVDQGHNRVVTNLLDVTLTRHDRFKSKYKWGRPFDEGTCK